MLTILPPPPEVPSEPPAMAADADTAAWRSVLETARETWRPNRFSSTPPEDTWPTE